MIKIILVIAAIIIVSIVVWCLMIPYYNRGLKKEEYDWWIRKSKLHTELEESLVTLDWHTVLSLYVINPERWSMDDVIQYRSDEDKIYTVLLSYDDYWLYEAWLEEKEQEEEQKAIKDILKCGQRDIERLRESIKEDLKKARDTTNEIKERLEKEKK